MAFFCTQYYNFLSLQYQIHVMMNKGTGQSFSNFGCKISVCILYTREYSFYSRFNILRASCLFNLKRKQKTSADIWCSVLVFQSSNETGKKANKICIVRLYLSFLIYTRKGEIDKNIQFPQMCLYFFGGESNCKFVLLFQSGQIWCLHPVRVRFDSISMTPRDSHLPQMTFYTRQPIGLEFEVSNL